MQHCVAQLIFSAISKESTTFGKSPNTNYTTQRLIAQDPNVKKITAKNSSLAHYEIRFDRMASNIYAQ